jgi:hypothetical protein
LEDIPLQRRHFLFFELELFSDEKMTALGTPFHLGER